MIKKSLKLKNILEQNQFILNNNLKKKDSIKDILLDNYTNINEKLKNNIRHKKDQIELIELK